MKDEETAKRPLVAIVGSARAEITAEKEDAARQACKELGRALANGGWGIAVYTDSEDFIEPDLVRGYVAEGGAELGCVTCFYPQGEAIELPDREGHPELFGPDRVDAASDWEVSFYRSLSEVDGILILGGRSSTLIAGHIALMRHLPIVSVAEFGGTGTKLWRYMKLKPDGLQDSDLEAMAAWSSTSARDCVQSLSRQREKRLDAQRRESAELSDLRERAGRLEKLEDEGRTRRVDILATLGLVSVLVILILVELEIGKTGGWYSAALLLSLLVAGGLGATVRVLTPDPPRYARWTPQIFGIVGGLFVGLLYMLPHLIGDHHLFTAGEEVSPQMHAQFLSVVVVAFLAGLGFEITLSQLLSKSKASGEEITKAPG
jgi:hypothetical protein